MRWMPRLAPRPRPRRPPRRAWLGVLSLVLVLVPAAGIAYLGAVSYREDRGLVAARLDEHFRVAAALAGQLEGDVRRTLDAVARALAESPAARDALAAYPLAAHPFRIGRDRTLEIPAAEPLRRRDAEPDFLARAPRSCPESGFETCIRALREARGREGQLDQARRHELGTCAGERCAASARDLEAARRIYQSLARFDDTGPEALAGLGRLALQSGDKDLAARHYQALATRFGSRVDQDSVSYRLIADLGLTETRGDASAVLELYETLLAPTYEAPSALLGTLADEVRGRLDSAPLDQIDAARLAALDARLAAARDQARFAAVLADEVEEIARTASAQPRGRPALTTPERTVIVRREPDGSIIGVIVDMAMLEDVAARAGLDLSRLAPGTRAVIERPGDAVRRSARTRTLASTGIGAILPHLSVSLVHDRSMPDPLDAIIESRGRRHLAITGGLVALLVIGLAATIRGASRERELARLRSDFVSAVSHELKTPLTSIRMFAEMLQEGVAEGDRTREARYHTVIVKESERLGLLIANLLDYSQIERGTRRYSPTQQRALDIAQAAVDTFQRFGAEPVDIRVSAATAAAEEAEIRVDREVVVQSLLNLLANAVKYGKPPIDVTVAAGDGIHISVVDRGPGVPPGEEERIFREFYRAPAAYSSGVEGTGLGLALVKRHVEAQGGHITVTSEPGQGATFSLHFPRS